ncbi:protachykinin-like [Perca flavescens]|uniref:protachykinin-like n=1 Tax=Perca flavescens TaxID=8167 RepID=UPI00106DF52E|nr:protachykinin-like [Perca flavescens]
MMELVKLVLIVVLLLTTALSQEMDVDNWREDIEEDTWPNSDVIQDIFVRMTRKPGPRQYLGLMGKKDSGHRFHTFVGLMGKRSFEDQGVILPTVTLNILKGDVGENLRGNR